jgi:hypothetical protein
MRERQPIPRRKDMGKQVSGPPLTQAEHFWNCEACGGWFDMRDLAGGSGGFCLLHSGRLGQGLRSVPLVLLDHRTMLLLREGHSSAQLV